MWNFYKIKFKKNLHDVKERKVFIKWNYTHQQQNIDKLDYIKMKNFLFIKWHH